MNTLLSELRKDCPMRHENGNCLPCGGFCTAVNDPICEALHNAYRDGADFVVDAIEKNDDLLMGLLWRAFSDVPMNPETEEMEEEFLGFPVGAHREEIWHWFDKKHSKGVAYLLYGENAGVREEASDARTVCR